MLQNLKPAPLKNILKTELYPTHFENSLSCEHSKTLKFFGAFRTKLIDPQGVSRFLGIKIHGGDCNESVSVNVPTVLKLCRYPADTS